MTNRIGTRRVVVTGMGIVSPIGVGKKAVTEALQNMKSGIVVSQQADVAGMKSKIEGRLDFLDYESMIDRKVRRFMGPGAAYNYIAMQEAITDSGLMPEQVSHERTGLVMGSGGPSIMNQVASVDTMREKGLRRVGPYMVPRCMSSTNSATLATPFGIRGVNYSMTSACATSAHCIGHGAELIQFGKQDIVFAGGGEEVFWALSMLFDAMGALSTKYNDHPTQASRPFDRDRDGFVISGGGGVLVLEDYEHAQKRGAPIYGELVGYGATSDGHDMVAPSGEGAMRCMRQALASVNTPVDYINAHGTSTPVGDVAECRAVREVFGTEVPPLSSTKSLTGHALGAAGVNEAIYSLLMLNEGFISGTLNLENVDSEISGISLPTETRSADLKTVMSNSFGFGGTNATLVFSRASL